MKKFIFIFLPVVLFVIIIQSDSFAAQTGATKQKSTVIELPVQNSENNDTVYSKNKKLKELNEIKTEKPDESEIKSRISFSETKAATKSFAIKTAETAKRAADKTVDTAKKGYKDASDTTKDIIDTANPNKTEEDYKSLNKLNSLKSEKKEIKSAYDSRIKDIDAKIKSAQNNSEFSDSRKAKTVNRLKREKDNLKKERQEYIDAYNAEIEKVRNSEKKTK